jgi:hypothetical protein
MSADSKITKKQLLKMIDVLEKNPNDKIRILGDSGVTLVGVGLGAAAAGTLASTAGVTSIFGFTTAASWLGVTAVAATPVGWVIGGAAVAGMAAYGVSRIIHNGGLAEGRKFELLQKYREATNSIEAKERAGSIKDTDKTEFIVSTRELIDKDVISPEEAFELIEHVEQGRIPIAYAYLMIQNLLEEKQPNTDSEKSEKKILSKKQIKKLEELENAYKEGFLSEVDFEKRVRHLTDVVSTNNKPTLD